MDERLQVKDPPRAVAAGTSAETPLATVAWRVLRAEHQRRADERRALEAEARIVREAFAVVAEEAYRLSRAAERAQKTTDETAAHARQTEAAARRLIEALSRAGVQIVAPEGEPYTAELMELLDNTAQQPDPQASEPHVAEIITPAVTYKGELLRMGRAVIAVPAAASGEGGAVRAGEAADPKAAEDGEDERADAEVEGNTAEKADAGGERLGGE